MQYRLCIPFTDDWSLECAWDIIPSPWISSKCSDTFFCWGTGLCSLPISIGGQIPAVDPRKGSWIIIIITIEPVFVRSSTVSSSCYKENHNDYFDIGDDKNDDIRQQIISAKKDSFLVLNLLNAISQSFSACDCTSMTWDVGDWLEHNSWKKICIVKHLKQYTSSKKMKDLKKNVFDVEQQRQQRK